METCKVVIGSHIEVELPLGMPLHELATMLQPDHDSLIVGFKINNQLKELHDTLQKNYNHLAIVDLNTSDGVRIYQRSLAFLFIRAVKDHLEGATVDIQHSLSGGLFCEIKEFPQLTEAAVVGIKNRMEALVALNEIFEKRIVPVSEAIEIFSRQGQRATAELLKYRKGETVNLYRYGDLYNYFYGYMVYRAGVLGAFELTPYDGGIILRHPTPFSKGVVPDFEPQPKIAQIHRESEHWGDILNIGYLYNINNSIDQGQMKEHILITEALHEKKIAQIADQITSTGKRVVLIAGPSSSGKTTFANRLRIQLMANGISPVTLSTDDYFVNREFTPVDEEGKYDFEAIEAVDLEQFNQDLNALLRGDVVSLPTFNFHQGKREYLGRSLKIEDHQPIIIEGIHGLNPKLTDAVAEGEKFRIYISCLTQLNIDNHNRIPTTDSRLIRRIVRDNKYRGHNALTTLRLWPSVRRGEERNIFPYQETADVMFNSAMVHELAILKKHIEPLLYNISDIEPEYAEAKRLLKFLSYVSSYDQDSSVPNTSIVREFIGGNIFYE